MARLVTHITDEQAQRFKTLAGVNKRSVSSELAVIVEQHLKKYEVAIDLALTLERTSGKHRAKAGNKYRTRNS